jgi:hypothetical protein
MEGALSWWFTFCPFVFFSFLMHTLPFTVVVGVKPDQVFILP